MRCPTCKQPLSSPPGRYRPFCSERCKMIDLGRWLGGEYAIAGEPATDEDLAADLQQQDSEETSPIAPGRRRN